ncbi:hypothetical protein BJF83_05150 [Nocardiopsis sp. CNR-923]|uniref:hypothetical protein n=1 Tax=Nocardiopsis sp. CNR-923 TaxID=1904965 RepID=UPI0009658033|nr:hypothetical protein [Nocardiopsis sp. CNR-923]OLT25554.1 hypothetical protein BJF83_05150 [Nocardiopsis sp. CNR-923]
MFASEMTALFLGRILFAYLLVAGIGVIFSVRFYADLAGKADRSDPMAVNISGMLHFLIGAAIVSAHFAWDSPLAVIVTLFGILFMLRGAAYLVVPHLVLRASTTSTTTLRLSGAFFVVTAAVLGYLSFLAV